MFFCSINIASQHKIAYKKTSKCSIMRPKSVFSHLLENRARAALIGCPEKLKLTGWLHVTEFALLHYFLRSSQTGGDWAGEVAWQEYRDTVLKQLEPGNDQESGHQYHVPLQTLARSPFLLLHHQLQKRGTKQLGSKLKRCDTSNMLFKFVLVPCDINSNNYV